MLLRPLRRRRLHRLSRTDVMSKGSLLCRIVQRRGPDSIRRGRGGGVRALTSRWLGSFPSEAEVYGNSKEKKERTNGQSHRLLQICSVASSLQQTQLSDCARWWVCCSTPVRLDFLISQDTEESFQGPEESKLFFCEPTLKDGRRSGGTASVRRGTHPNQHRLQRRGTMSSWDVSTPTWGNKCTGIPIPSQAAS